MASQKEEVSTNQEIDVINISGEDLTTAELSLLRKGLKYAPTMDFDLFNTAIDVHKFVRKLTLKSFFHKRSQFVGPTDDNSLDTVGGVNLSGAPPTPHPEDSEAPIGDPAPSTPSFREACDLQDMLDLEELLYDNDVSSEQIVIPEFSNWRSNLKKGSVFDPQFSKGPFLTTFENLVIRDLRILAEGYSLTNVGKHNLNYKEKQALLSLQKNSRIVIKNADKGGAVVVQSRAAYLKEAYRQLGDATTYSALPDDPTERFLKSYKELLEVGAITQVLNKTENTFLWNPNPIIPVFYHLPKVHKTLVDPPGRPIISSIGSLGDGLSKYIDQYLQPFVKNLPSFLLDSGDLIRKLKNVKWNPQFIWVTMDVTSLYSVIRHDQGVAAVEHFIGGPDSNHFHTAFILDAINFLLTHNYFLFDRTFYLQQRGTAMGTSFAPVYANLFMGWWESLFIFSSTNPFRKHIIFYRRFIDDLIMIWDGDSDSLHNFFHYINTNDLNLVFTHNFNTQHIDYLDLRLFIDIKGQIQTETFRKPNARNMLLRADSCHPPAVIRAMATGGKGRDNKNRDKPPPATSNDTGDEDTEVEATRPPSGTGDQEWARVKDIKELCDEMWRFFKSELWALRKDLDALGE
ncbi:uncharacterized protein LOC142498600 [Ascaphus truei]|uniref:uncharacterized protein LOC142498600 n=1 Tax=Ascaphus truei TaxID=8439 RepID=UPI003F5929B4